ncbi:MAG TPA: metallophosphoesterase [Bacillota bacterium]|jgi:predicted phosphohydrolase|nr:serine/threonine protein phosphatase [Clostridiales bacterium UBA9856]HOA43300.1 metallophosphoesterase [Bacillota bacterium]HPZ59355.1 metallophosphoesterase [Bacillota bacterium]HQC82832.1 metallophosphoesterase [Bacillota bacterium]
MNIFAIGDLHLSTDGAKPMDIYGGQWIRHAERLEQKWRSVVEEDDIVIVAGDISWAMKRQDATEDLEWIARLPGKKVLIKGNHDLWWTSVTKLNQFYESMFFLQNSCYIAGDTAICGSRGWVCPGDTDFTEQDEKIYNRELGRLRLSLESAKNAGAAKIIGAMHFPPTNDKHEKSGFTALFEEYGVKMVVYGHLHGPEAHLRGIQGKRNGVEYRLVSCDYLKCSPLLIHRVNVSTAL